MSRALSPRPAPRRAPTVERLESRELLAAKAAPQVTFTEVPETGTASFTLQIVGTSKNDSIFIQDDGKGAAGSLRITTASGQSFVSQHADATTQVITGGGKDTLNYNLSNGLQANVKQALIAASGGTFIGSTKAIKGGGTLKVTANIAGPIAAGSSFFNFIGSDPHAATTLNVSAASTVNGGLVVGILKDAKAKAGPVTVNATAAGTIGRDGSLALFGEGGKSKNLMNVSYAGTNNGALNVVETGSGDKDDLSANLQMTAGSTGTVGNDTTPAQVGSTGKGAKIRFAIFRGADSTTKTGINAEVSASNKKATIAHTANVTNLASGTETIIT